MMMNLTPYRATYSLHNVDWRQRAARRPGGRCASAPLGLVPGNALVEVSRGSALILRIRDSLVTDRSTTAFLTRVGHLTERLVVGKGRGGRHSPARARTIARTGLRGIRPAWLWL